MTARGIKFQSMTRDNVDVNVTRHKQCTKNVSVGLGCRQLQSLTHFVLGQLESSVVNNTVLSPVTNPRTVVYSSHRRLTVSLALALAVAVVEYTYQLRCRRWLPEPDVVR